MQIPTTDTILDKQAEVKELGEQIARLTREKEKMEAGTREAVLFNESLNERKATLERIVGEYVQLCTEVIKTASEATQEAVAVAQKASETVSSTLECLGALDAKIAKSIDELQTIEGYKMHQLEILSKETIGVQTSKEDLDVYRDRLQKIIKDNNLNITIV